MKNEKLGFLGIDIGGTQTKFCITTASARAVSKQAVPTLAQRGQVATLKNIVDVAADLIGQAPLTVTAVGIGVCGPTDASSGSLITSPILTGWQMVPLRELFQSNLSLPTFVDNDANLAIWAEAIAGAAKGARNVVGLTVGTGVGGAVIIDGSIYRGSHWYGGELGHMTVVPNGSDCPCGNRGCLTIEASSKSLVNRYAQMGGYVGSTPKQIFDQAKAGDPIATEAIRPMIDALSIGIANVLNIFDPDFVVIAGGPTNTGVWLLDRLRDQVQARVFNDIFKQARIVFAELGGWAGALGAGALAAALSGQNRG